MIFNKKRIAIWIILVMVTPILSHCTHHTPNQIDESEMEISKEEMRLIANFLDFFTEKPVLKSFDQLNTCEVVRFSLYKLVELKDENITYDDTYHRYHVSTEYLKSFISNYFEIGKLGYCSDQEFRFKKDSEDVSFVESWQESGSFPVIESATKIGNYYYIEGHLDVPKPRSGYDADIPPGLFSAVISETENGDLRMYEFEIHY